MTTNLLVLHQDIPRAAVTIDCPQVAFNECFPLLNAKGGFRYSRLRSEPLPASAYNTLDIIYDLKSTDARAADFFYLPLAKKNPIDQWGGGVSLFYSDDRTSWTEVFSEADLGNATMVGRDRVDYFNSFTQTGSHQYWRVRFSSVQEGKVISIGAPIFGLALDLDDDWSSWRIAVRDDNKPFVSDNSAIYPNKTSEIKRYITAEWYKVTDAKLQILEQQVINYSNKSGVVLRASRADFVTDAETFLHLKVTDTTTTKNLSEAVVAYNNIKMLFEEL